MPHVTPEIGLLALASCSDGQRPIGEIHGWLPSGGVALAVIRWLKQQTRMVSTVLQVRQAMHGIRTDFGLLRHIDGSKLNRPW